MRYYTFFNVYLLKYGRSGNISEILIFVNFAKKTNSLIQESRKNYYNNSAIKKRKIREF